MSEVQQAVALARQAFSDWSNIPLAQRISFIESYREQLNQHKAELTETISKEVGKPLWDSANEVASMIGKIALTVEAYQKRCGDQHLPLSYDKLLATRHRPHGALAILGPFNFPGHLPNGHIIPALLIGNTVIFKPSEYTPQVGKLMASCWEKAGLPAGVFNIVYGGKEVGKALASSPDIDGLFFTGSYAAGRSLAEQFCKTPEKILALEMGGNNPLIVADIDNIPASAYVTIVSAYLTSGQRCSCARRLILVESEKSSGFLDALLAMIKKVDVGVYTKRPEPFMGPVVSAEAAQHLLKKQEFLKQMGGKPLIEMQLLEPNTGLLSPGIIDMSAISEKPDEEIFGPLLQLVRVPNFAAALQEANNTSYGLTAGLLSRCREDYNLFLNTVRAGVMNWNTPLTGSSSAAPFGGIGRSGNHRPSAYYAVDYCSYPVASMEAEAITIPSLPTPGLAL